MADDREQKPAKGAAGQNQAGGDQRRVAAASDANPAVAAAPVAAPCCCDILYVYLQKVQCKKKTSSFGVSLTSDEIAITSLAQQEGGGPMAAKWPDNQSTYSMDTGESTADDLAFLLAKFTPNSHCKINAEVAINVWRVNFFYDIQKAVQEAVGRAGVIGQSLTGLPSVGQSLTALVDRLYHFAGAGEVPIGDPIRLPFHHDFACTSPLPSLLSAGIGRSMTADGDDACTLTRTVRGGNGGEYEISLRIERDCSDRAVHGHK